MSDMLLEGRSAIVTGGGRGIGKAICEELASAGASVVVADTGGAIDGSGEDSALAATVAKKCGARAVPYSKNIASPKAASEMVKLAMDHFAGIDIVINCAPSCGTVLFSKALPGIGTRS